MKALTSLSLALGLHAGLGVSLLVLPDVLRPSALTQQLRDRLKLPDLNIQTPPFMNPLFPSPGGNGGNDRDDDPRHGDQVISDVVGSHRNINIFAGLMRNVDEAYKRISDAGSNSTILAPSNAAMNKMSHKPWEDAGEYVAMGAEAYQGQAGEDRANKNLRRFVGLHIVMQSPWPEKEKATTLSGAQIWWEMKDGKKVIQPGEVVVSSEMAPISNGEIWVLESAQKV